MTENSENTRALLRHLVATLAYRAAKVLRDVPPSFAQFSSGRDTRLPMQILQHLGDLMAWGLRMAQGEYLWRAEGSGDWNTEVRRFFEGLRALDQFLASDAPLPSRRDAHPRSTGGRADARRSTCDVARCSRYSGPA